MTDTARPSTSIDGEMSRNSLGNRLLNKEQQEERDTRKTMGPRTTLGPRLSGNVGKPPRRRTAKEPDRALAIAELDAALTQNPTLLDPLISAEMQRIPRARKGALVILLAHESKKPEPRPDVVACLQAAIEKPPENGTPAGATDDEPPKE